MRTYHHLYARCGRSTCLGACRGTRVWSNGSKACRDGGVCDAEPGGGAEVFLPVSRGEAGGAGAAGIGGRAGELDPRRERAAAGAAGAAALPLFLLAGQADPLPAHRHCESAAESDWAGEWASVASGADEVSTGVEQNLPVTANRRQVDRRIDDGADPTPRLYSPAEPRILLSPVPGPFTGGSRTAAPRGL